MGISVIIPTFDNVEFIDETLNSIYESGDGLEYEVLIGIDGCNKTLKYLKNKVLPDNTKVFFFQENKGPYLIKNTLSTLSFYDNLLFFDSDDIMKKNMINYCINSLKKYECVKPKLRNFRIVNGNIIDEEKRKHWGEGVFAIKKDIFNFFNGFEGWVVAADSDFMGRIYKNNIKVELTKEILMLRRIHNKGLTSRSDTGFRSSLRSYYAGLSKSKKGTGRLEVMAVSEFLPIDEAKYSTNNSEHIVSKILIKDKTKNPVNDLLKRLDENKTIPQEINYEKVNEITNNRQIQKKQEIPRQTHKNSNRNAANILFTDKKMKSPGQNGFIVGRSSFRI